ncbi:MAG: hypothetical protein MJZ20_07880 [Bacteroidaceae bacterium]|nr:hypothetical protein [Bacteroidaceae bacterium]
MKQVHMGGYSVVIPDGYVHKVLVSRIKGSQDVRLGLGFEQRANLASRPFGECPCWESDLH